MSDLPQGSAIIKVTQALIDAYAVIAGDFNPVHVDPVFAATTPFGATIAHGCIPMETIFRLVQAHLGRPVMPQGSRMKLRYLRPSHPGDTIGIVVKTQHESGLEFQCVNQSGQPVIEGEVRYG
jgi:3-hydroxybutyryl-CoA dehydratase